MDRHDEQSRRRCSIPGIRGLALYQSRLGGGVRVECDFLTDFEKARAGSTDDESASKGGQTVALDAAEHACSALAERCSTSIVTSIVTCIQRPCGHGKPDAANSRFRRCAGKRGAGETPAPKRGSNGVLDVRDLGDTVSWQARAAAELVVYIQITGLRGLWRVTCDVRRVTCDVALP